MNLYGVEPQVVSESLAHVRQQLLAMRTPAGHWEGYLSSSALSTATATFALWLYDQLSPQFPPLPGGEGYKSYAAREVLLPLPGGEGGRGVRFYTEGVRWLVSHQNVDGGWGDTPDSLSNISTTTLCWAALRAIGGDPTVEGAVSRAELCLHGMIQLGGQIPPHPNPPPPGGREPKTPSPLAGEGWGGGGGSLEPTALTEAIARRYGKDRTFSVPILTFCALAGQLGPEEQAWRLIPHLPFELAAFPQSWFRYIHLPVVSYALPALIAMGQVHHYRRPTRNPFARLLRTVTWGWTLRVLQQIQPPGGGFLEATPLTSFVVMSLTASGNANHPVTTRGITFLMHSMREDGSWPIDTNLATWGTTLSINALAAGGHLEDHLTPKERNTLRAWLLKQQYQIRHPYTDAAPGGWAWTSLPGGVPDADDTAGALLALHNLAGVDQEVLTAVNAGVCWLLDLQNADGGIPTFCRGWGYLPFDRSSPELTAHALLAWDTWRDRLAPDLGVRITRALERAVQSLRQQQHPDGSWIPLWFGNQAAPHEENPVYGTARVVSALCKLKGRESQPVPEMLMRGVEWLISAQDQDGGWGGASGVAPSVEETGHALHALLAAYERERTSGWNGQSRGALERAIGQGLQWLIHATDQGNHFSPAPLGLYFAKLWYSERLYPLIAMAGALGNWERDTE